MKTGIATVTALLLFVSAAHASALILAPVERGVEYIYPEPDDYQLAVVTLDYEVINHNFIAHLSGTGLKPEFTYQVKLEGIPACAGGNDETNERIGYAGRWTCLDCEASPAGNNRSDAQYEANKLLPDGDPDKECIAGYLVFDWFVADPNGDADVWVETDGSYHVLWCGPTSGSNADLHSGYTPPTSYCDDGKYCADPNITPEIERPAFQRLPDGQYTDVRFVLTEESFHQNCGTWCSVLAREILFEIQGDYDADADGCANLIDPYPNVRSTDADEDGYGADCDCDDQNDGVHPEALEGSDHGGTCTDDLDNDCDGFTDEEDESCEPAGSWGEAAVVEASALKQIPVERCSIINRFVSLLFPIGVILLMRRLSSGRKR